MNVVGEKPDPDPGRIAYLIAGFLQDNLTEAEHNELDDWIEAAPENMRLFEELTDEENLQATQAWYQQQEAQKAKKQQRYRTIQRQIGGGHTRSMVWYLAAAAVFGLCIGLYFLTKTNTPGMPSPVANGKNKGDAQPRQAVLILADGRIVSLDSGQTVREPGLTIENGTITHTPMDFPDTGYNTIRVPEERQFKLELADGSTVWLNAGTTFRYPASFGKQSRRVTLTGEAFFRVSHDAAHPFTVSSPAQEVTVLGTQFNVNAYAQAVPVTTLVEGRVQVAGNGQTKFLSPGEQSRVTARGIGIETAEVEEAVAWRDGLFLFRSAPIETIATQLQHWYGVEVIYAARPTQHFNATIPRTESLERVLQVLEGSGFVHFKLVGRRLYVRP